MERKEKKNLTSVELDKDRLLREDWVEHSLFAVKWIWWNVKTLLRLKWAVVTAPREMKAHIKRAIR